MFQETKEIQVTAAPRIGQWHELAEAIRRGCEIAPKQCFGMYTDRNGAACVVKSANLGGYIPYLRGIVSGKYPSEPCPDCARDHGYALLPTLNDLHIWTRERIADWLDAL